MFAKQVRSCQRSHLPSPRFPNSTILTVLCSYTNNHHLGHGPSLLMLPSINKSHLFEGMKGSLQPYLLFCCLSPGVPLRFRHTLCMCFSCWVVIPAASPCWTLLGLQHHSLDCRQHLAELPFAVEKRISQEDGLIVISLVEESP